MALRLWASSTANALRISVASTAHVSPSYSLSRCFSTVLDGLKYATSHEWVKHEGSVATIGITDHAQNITWLSQFCGESRLHRHSFTGDFGLDSAWLYAIDHLGEVVFVDLPEADDSVSQGKSFGAVESVKATSDINSPISGEIVEVNTQLSETPGLINKSPYEEGWMIKVKPSNPSEIESLLGPKEYTKLCEEEDH
ncbi:glycine cleavage system H protein [Populus alba x Populus x berolinensis]|uniref:Glycine cleavage system H protein n=1 Tax=Populus alba x Populus x berolinensis TaxID=444605 RepID=A0AAD6RLV4_9ROSI|nr:glycine cleavage system H protein [Populus alba x Populus x berolinensis]